MENLREMKILLEGPHPDYATEEGAYYMAQLLFGKLRVDFERDGSAGLEVVILAQIDPLTREPFAEVSPLALASPPDMDRKDLPGALRSAAKDCGAVGILFATEAWLAMSPVPPGHPDCPFKGGSIEDVPGRFEAVFVSLEHKKTGRKIWTAMITEEEGGKRVLEEFKELPIDAMKGNFADLLPKHWMN